MDFEPGTGGVEGGESCESRRDVGGELEITNCVLRSSTCCAGALDRAHKNYLSGEIVLAFVTHRQKAALRECSSKR